MFENEGVGVVQLELPNQQVPCENLAAQLEIMGKRREKNVLFGIAEGVEENSRHVWRFVGADGLENGGHGALE